MLVVKEGGCVTVRGWEGAMSWGGKGKEQI
jgi:hypothetical protein